MNNHLNEDQITEWVLGTRDEYVLHHLATCDACIREAGELRSTISGFRDAVHAAAQRDPSFWINQQRAVRERLAAGAWLPLHWAWVMAAVMVLIAVISLTRTPNPPQNYATEDADKALLQEVQGDLAREVPQALAPAVLIAEERNEILANKGVRQDETTPKKTR